MSQGVIEKLREDALQWHKDKMEMLNSCGRKSILDIETCISRDYGFLMAAYWSGAISKEEIETMIEEIKELGERRRKYSENPSTFFKADSPVYALNKANTDMPYFLRKYESEKE